MLGTINEVKGKLGLITGKLDYRAGITHEKIERAWQDIATAVNALYLKCQEQ